MHLMKITFLQDVENFKEGDQYEIQRHLAKRYIRAGQATSQPAKKTTTKKKTRKKIAVASTTPDDLERAVE